MARIIPNLLGLIVRCQEDLNRILAARAATASADVVSAQASNRVQDTRSNKVARAAVLAAESQSIAFSQKRQGFAADASAYSMQYVARRDGR